MAHGHAFCVAHATERFRREDTGHDTADNPAHAVHAEHIARVINAQNAFQCGNTPQTCQPRRQTDEQPPADTDITTRRGDTNQTGDRTSITFEYPSAEGDPYYPIPRPENQALFKRYEALALAQPDVSFVGRLATYRYYNMDQVVAAALAAAQRLLG